MFKSINKSNYLEYLKCAKNSWLKMHKPELAHLFALSEFEQSIVEKGKLVEVWAKKLFLDGISLEHLSKDASILATQRHIKQKTSVLFQSIFIYKDFLVRNDILEYDPETGCWNLYEIKGSNSIEENVSEIDHIEDLAFQSIVLSNNGIALGKIFIRHLNKDYLLNDDININELFSTQDVTEEVNDRAKGTWINMQKAASDLLKSEEHALVCTCIYKGRSAHCKTFRYSHKYVPDYSVHDIARIGMSKKKLPELVNAGILNINDIPENIELTAIQKKQVDAHKLQQPIIENTSIIQELDKLEFPLYFLDYESYSPAIPTFKGFKPYQQIPFQFSLHVINDGNSDPIHYEYLHELDSDPSQVIILQLQELIKSKGTVVVWHKSFERINKELSMRHGEYQSFLENINVRIYDLEEIFKQLYVHPEFRGKTSIKKVLPVLVPKLSYKELEIQEGGAAALKWVDMVYGNLSLEEKQKIANDLRLYCERDTYAMYKIWKLLRVSFHDSLDAS